MYSGHHGHSARRWWRWFLAWFFVTGAVIVIGLVIEQTLNPGPASTWGQPPSPAETPIAIPTGTPVLTRPLPVVPGSQQVNGIELGFPHSTAGAVSAADADALEVFSTLDPNRAAAVMRMIADPSWPNAPQVAAGGVVNDRKHFGLPATGPFPADASLQTEPAEYEVRDVTPDRVLVLLLCDASITMPDQGTTTEIGVLPFQMHWSDADWKVQSVNATQAELNLAVEPDSPQAAAYGWQDLRPAGG